MKLYIGGNAKQLGVSSKSPNTVQDKGYAWVARNCQFDYKKLVLYALKIRQECTGFWMKQKYSTQSQEIDAQQVMFFFLTQIRIYNVE